MGGGKFLFRGKRKSSHSGLKRNKNIASLPAGLYPTNTVRHSRTKMNAEKNILVLHSRVFFSQEN